jgi:hypothetical protein
MNLSLDIISNPNEIFENDAVIVNIWTGHITWKPMMYNEKLRENILYWLKEKKKNAK